MFGENDKKQELVGASAKIEAAERMKAAGRIAAHQETAEGQSYNQNVPALVVYVLAVLLVLMLMNSSDFNLSGWHLTGDRSIDSFLTGSTIPSFFGDKSIDTIILVFLRALVFSLFAGIVPLLGKMIAQLVPKDTINPFMACWAAVIAIPFLYVMFVSFLAPLFEDMLRGF